MTLLPHRFLFRVAHPCRYVKAMPADEGDSLLDLPESCRLDNFAAMDDARNFADVRLAWNELGVGVQVEVRGKSEVPRGDAARPNDSAHRSSAAINRSKTGDRLIQREQRIVCHNQRRS